jgi:hypothetical protein
VGIRRVGSPVTAHGVCLLPRKSGLSGRYFRAVAKWLFAIPGRPGPLCQPSFQHWRAGGTQGDLFTSNFDRARLFRLEERVVARAAALIEENPREGGARGTPPCGEGLNEICRFRRQPWTIRRVGWVLETDVRVKADVVRKCVRLKPDLLRKCVRLKPDLLGVLSRLWPGRARFWLRRRLRRRLRSTACRARCCLRFPGATARR